MLPQVRLFWLTWVGRRACAMGTDPRLVQRHQALIYRVPTLRRKRANDTRRVGHQRGDLGELKVELRAKLH